MKKRIGIGMGLGALAGILDVIPMILQDLTWDANISAFLMWVVIGFLLSVIEIKLNAILKGILISFMVLLEKPESLTTSGQFGLIRQIVWRSAV